MKPTTKQRCLSFAFALALCIPLNAALAETPDNGEPPQHDLTPQTDAADSTSQAGHGTDKRAAMSDSREKSPAMTSEQVASKLHLVNTKEIRMGKLAVQRGQSQEVKNYGQRLVDDHQKADQELKTAANRANITLSEPKLSAEDMAKEKKLENLSGNEFDKMFLKDMHEGHGKVAEELRACKDELKNAEIKSVVQKQLPVIESHEKRAMELMKDNRKG